MLRTCIRVATIVLTVVGAAHGGWDRRGVSLTLWNQTVDTGQLAQSLDDMVDAGVTDVAVNVWWFQENISATTIAPDFTAYSASDASVEYVIGEVHSRGMSAMLKPLVDLSNDSTHWRGQITGGPAWFTGAGGYGDFINHFADLAQRTGAEQLCVGTELDATTSQESHWRDAIAGVRTRYDGQLTYAANQGGSAAVTATPVAWWDAVDAFGLDAYYPLTTVNDPTVAQLQAAWASHAARIEAWRNAIDPAKPVLLTEVGYRSWDGTNRHPYSGDAKDGTNVDTQEQADCYEAVLSQLWDATWTAGGYFWNWEVDPDPTWEVPNWYIIQGKPALDVMASYYAATPGDADRDGDVDLDDFLYLKVNFGVSSGAGWADGDFDRDGDVDLDDFVVLKNSFGTTSVPEPATWVMLAMGAGVMLRRRRQVDRGGAVGLSGAALSLPGYCVTAPARR